MSGVDIKALIERLRRQAEDEYGRAVRAEHYLWRTADALEALQAENMEQARLLGMSAERELAAQSRIAELEAELAAAREALEAISMPSPRRKALRPQYAGLLAREIAIRALAGGPTA